MADARLWMHSHRPQCKPDFDLYAGRPAAMTPVEAYRSADCNVTPRTIDVRDHPTAFYDRCADSRSRVLYVPIKHVAEHAPQVQSLRVPALDETREAVPHVLPGKR